MKTLIVSTDDDMSTLKGRATIIGVAESVERAAVMLERNDLDMVVLDRDIMSLLGRLSNKEGSSQESKSEQLDRQEETKEEKVRAVMKQLSFPPNLTGYKYLEETLLYILSQDTNRRPQFKEMNVEVARMFDSTPHRVERGIRHLIESRWLRIPLRVRKEVFGGIGDLPMSPTTSEFAYTLIEYIRSS